MMKIALSFGILPKDFWQLSLLEWRNCFGQNQQFMRKKDLETLIENIERNSQNE